MVPEMEAWAVILQKEVQEFLKKSYQEVGKTAQWLRVLDTLPEGLGLMPRIHAAAPASGDPARSSDFIHQENVP